MYNTSNFGNIYSDLDRSIINNPTAVLTGESGVGKSSLQELLIHEDFKLGYNEFIGRAGTTPYPMKTRLCQEGDTAQLIIRLKDNELLQTDSQSFLLNFLMKTITSCKASAPADKQRRLDFYREEAGKHLEDKELPRFRIGKMFGKSDPALQDFLTELLEQAHEKALNESFAPNWATATKIDRDRMLYEFVVDFMDHTPEYTPATSLAELLREKARRLLTEIGLREEVVNSNTFFWADSLTGEQFTVCAAALTNRKTKNKENVPESAACIVKEIWGSVPMTTVNQKLKHPLYDFMIVDTAGLNNDGNKDAVRNQTLKDTLSETFYDAVIVVDNAAHPHYTTRQETIRAVADAIRPCQLIAALTHLDKLGIFETDDEEDRLPEFSEVKEAVEEELAEARDMLSTALGTAQEVHFLSKNEEIIAIGVSKKLSKAYPDTYFTEGRQTEQLLTVLGRAFRLSRARIKNHNIDDNGLEDCFIQISQTTSLQELVDTTLSEVIHRHIGQSFFLIRDTCGAFHHWTLTALFRALIQMENYYSNAFVYENVNCNFFTNVVEACYAELSQKITFHPDVNLPRAEDRDMLINEFKANLNKQLRNAIQAYFVRGKRNVFLETDDWNNYPATNEKIRDIYYRPRYNRRKDLQDLIDILTNHVKNDTKAAELLVACLDRSIENARQETYDRLIAYHNK